MARVYGPFGRSGASAPEAEGVPGGSRGNGEIQKMIFSCSLDAKFAYCRILMVELAHFGGPHRFLGGLWGPLSSCHMSVVIMISATKCLWPLQEALLLFLNSDLKGRRFTHLLGDVLSFHGLQGAQWAPVVISGPPNCAPWAFSQTEEALGRFFGGPGSPQRALAYLSTSSLFFFSLSPWIPQVPARGSNRR